MIRLAECKLRQLYLWRVNYGICCGLGPGVSNPRRVGCYKFWDVVNIVIMQLNFR